MKLIIIFFFFFFSQAAHKKKELVLEEKIPEWVDEQSVREGQKFFKKNITLCFLALNKALTLGLFVWRIIII